MSKRKQYDDSDDSPPILKTAGLASGRYIAKRYRNSVRPVVKTTVPMEIKHLVYMQDYSSLLERIGAEAIHAPDYNDRPEHYKQLAALKGKEISHFDSSTDTLYTLDEATGVDFLSRAWDVTPERVHGTVAQQAELARAGWKFVIKTDNVAWFANTDKNTVYGVFDHFKIDRDNVFKDMYKNNVETENALVLRNIPRNDIQSIEQHPYYSEEAGKNIRDFVGAARSDGMDVRFTGYSLGGHLAKYWGSKLNIDQDVVNAHVFPHNTFDATDATTNFHTIATDETDFKYILPSDSSVIQNDTHTLYPPSKRIEKLNFRKGNIWGRHLKQGFLEPSSEFDIPAAKNYALKTSRIGDSISAAQTGLAVADVATYIADKDYAGAGTAIAEQGSWLNPIAGAGVMSTELAYTAQNDYKEGKYGTAARHGTESLAMAKTAIKANPESIFFAAEAIGSVEAAFDASKARKSGDKTEFRFKTAESALLGAGVLSSLVLGPVGLLMFGVADGGVALADHIRKTRQHRKEIATAKTNGFEQHAATRSGPYWHSDLPRTQDAYVKTQQEYTAVKHGVSSAMTQPPLTAATVVSHSATIQDRQTPAWHYAFSDVKKQYIM